MVVVGFRLSLPLSFYEVILNAKQRDETCNTLSRKLMINVLQGTMNLQKSGTSVAFGIPDAAVSWLSDSVDK